MLKESIKKNKSKTIQQCGVSTLITDKKKVETTWLVSGTISVALILLLIFRKQIAKLFGNLFKGSKTQNPVLQGSNVININDVEIAKKAIQVEQTRIETEAKKIESEERIKTLEANNKKMAEEEKTRRKKEKWERIYKFFSEWTTRRHERKLKRIENWKETKNKIFDAWEAWQKRRKEKKAEKKKMGIKSIWSKAWDWTLGFIKNLLWITIICAVAYGIYYAIIQFVNYSPAVGASVSGLVFGITIILVAKSLFTPETGKHYAVKLLKQFNRVIAINCREYHVNRRSNKRNWDNTRRENDIILHDKDGKWTPLGGTERTWYDNRNLLEKFGFYWVGLWPFYSVAFLEVIEERFLSSENQKRSDENVTWRNAHPGKTTCLVRSVKKVRGVPFLTNAAYLITGLETGKEESAGGTTTKESMNVEIIVGALQRSGNLQLEYFSGIKEIDQTIVQDLFSEMRDWVSSIDSDNLNSGKHETEDSPFMAKMRGTSNRMKERFGISFEESNFLDWSPDRKGAEIYAAKQDVEIEIQKKAATIIKAEGEKQAAILDSQGKKEAEINIADGENYHLLKTGRLRKEGDNFVPVANADIQAGADALKETSVTTLVMGPGTGTNLLVEQPKNGGAKK